MAWSLARMQMSVFGVSFIRAVQAMKLLYPAVHAHNVRKKEAAIQHTHNYYKFIKEYSGFQYNPEKAAQLEVEWWWIHDELEHEQDKSRLTHAFAHLYAELIQSSSEQVMAAARHKTEATQFHDKAEDPQTLPEDITSHWDKAEVSLLAFYTELQRVDNAN